MKNYRYLFIPFLFMLLCLPLIGCGDKEGQQRKAFIDFLQNTVLRGGEQLPMLSEDQRQKFGVYVGDYFILLNFSQQLHDSVATGVLPLISDLDAIRTPQDYSRQLLKLQQGLAVVNFLAQQIHSNKTQSDQTVAILKQSNELKAVYSQVYAKIAIQPTQRLLPLFVQLDGLVKEVIEVGTFLTTYSGQVAYVDGAVQLGTPQLVAEYNRLMESLQSKQTVLQLVREQILLNRPQ